MCFGFFNKLIEKSVYTLLLQAINGGTTSDSPTSAPVLMSAPPPFYALIIGINEYASPKVDNLKGAVPDALAVRKYLEQNFGVPESQIRFLCNAEATRGRIIQEFNNLVADQRVHRGDPILIFYAGHGGEVDPPMGWEAGDSKIQMLIPHDFRTTVDGRKVYGIPDRTIGTLLSRIAETWGDNITVIFDCCHSGSGTRSRLARVTHIPNNVPSDLDLEIWRDAQRKNRGPAIAPGFLHYGLRSHVLLAACGAKEIAYEDQGSGVFTRSLLKTLSAVGAHNVTYANLLQRLPNLSSQNPQCEGIHRNRTIFNDKAHSQGRALFKVKRDNDNYVMEAGTAHGIDVGDEFTLYDDPQPSRKLPPLGVFVVRGARPFDSNIAPRPGNLRLELDNPAFALLTKASTKQDLRVYVASHKKLARTFAALVKMQDEQPHRPRILEAEKKHAKLGIDMNGKNIVFDILDERVTAFNLRRIPFSVQSDVNILQPILDAAAHFYWHLHRSDKHHNLQEKVRLEFVEVEQVEGKYDEDLNPVIEPIGKNLNRNGVINLVSNDKVMYGIKIISDTSLPLYTALFYFDNNNLSIKSFYQPPFSGQYKVDPSLRPSQSITLGYGSGGAVPYVYTLPEGQDVEIGFLKLFLSTEYVDLSDIPQSSPFTDDLRRAFGRAERSHTRRSIWDTILATVVIRKE